MKVISPFFIIQDDLDQQGLITRIEACGRVCYKSEDKIGATSAAPFVRNIINRGHNSVLEMAVFTLRVAFDIDSALRQFLAALPKYFSIDQLGKKEVLITGSVRAFREFGQAHANIKMVKAIMGYLARQNPLLFEDCSPKRGWPQQIGFSVEKMPLSIVDALPVDELGRHRYVGVKFIVNRAVTHEIVRHRPCSFLQESQRYCRYSEDKFGNEVTFIKPVFFAEESEEYRVWEEAMQDAERQYLKLLESSTPQAARTVLPNSCKTELIVYTNLQEWRHIFRLRTSPAAEPSMREIMIPLLAVFKQRFPSIFEGISAE